MSLMASSSSFTSLMASSSSSTSRNYSYNVFASFHGEDVRKTLLSHILQQFDLSGISMFDDEGIERSATIAPSLKKAIKESRISIVILSKNYASSGWCLDELVDIMEAKETMGQIVMTIFYGVEPSDVRKQTGDFGIAFNKTCERKKPTDERRQKWSQALKDVGNIEGEDFLRWKTEAAMIKKVIEDVLEKLNVTPSKDFDEMVGIEAHLRKMESLLDLAYDGVKMVAITGPSGIGKTTIARALHSRISNRFRLTCFVENLRESYHSGFDEYGLKLGLQKQFLSNILNQERISISHLGAVKQNLGDQRVLIILDDVNNIKQLEALANDITWFGPGSRIVVTTENKELLQQHGINNTYHVGFPSREEALVILCRYAFRQSSPPHFFEGLARRVTELCGNLPLGLRVVGSSLRGKNEDEWEEVIQRLKTIIDHQDIEEVLRVGYESLHEKEQSLFLHIAVFFNYRDGDLVRAMFAGNNNLDIKHGLKILVDRSLVYMSTNGEIVMHKLLQQVATKAAHREEPWKRRILINAQEICDVLERAEGTRAVSGISFDISGIDKLSISKKAFKRMPNLRFLRVYKSKDDGNDVLRISKEIEFPCRRLRLLEWNAYPNKFLPLTFHPEYLVKLDMTNSKLKYLWKGTQPLTNLKEMNLSCSVHLKELPDLTNATNLETLYLNHCTSLVEIPSSFSHLHKLETLRITECTNLQVIPANLNLPSLDYIPESIKDLHQLKFLFLSGCERITSLPELPRSLMGLFADDCESLETVLFPNNTPNASLNFINCSKLNQQTQREIILRSLRDGNTRVTGREVPAEFEHRERGNSLTIRLDGNMPLRIRFKLCLVISPNDKGGEQSTESVICRRFVNGELVLYDEEIHGYYIASSDFIKVHLYIFVSNLQYNHSGEVSSKVVFEFSSKDQDMDILECGAHIQSINESEPLEDDAEEEDRTNEEICASNEDDTEAGDRTYEEICDSKEQENIHCAKQRNRRSGLFSCFNFARKTFFKSKESLVTRVELLLTTSLLSRDQDPGMGLVVELVVLVVLVQPQDQMRSSLKERKYTVFLFGYVSFV
ncbi:unnamed protein product [Microthlaspi erraticum]|uniref:ADP-ribosyl cyclase/cyclic ADP-ribose hydrolase n=1 Tax=Microthlaspi erraticum TaxID=1685480 RepID=A0A6D2KXM7_9BRAS|nr:unnamed protein product [Microthlaspi erraticum]